MSALDEQVGGSHYKDCAIQPMEYSMANHLDACQHTIIKYVTRFRQDGGMEDLHKAKHTLDMLIEFEKKGESIPTEMELNFGEIVPHEEILKPGEWVTIGSSLQKDFVDEAKDNPYTGQWCEEWLKTRERTLG